MEIITKIFTPASLWEVVMLIIVVYFIFRPDLVDRITKFKVGNFEFELSEIKKEIQEGKDKISELQNDLENEKRQFEELLTKFDANAPIGELTSIKHTIKSQSRNISDNEILSKYLNKSSTPEELYATAVAIREKRPVELLPEIVSLLDDLASDKNLGGYRLNTVWTLTSAIHKILIACVRDNIKPFPATNTLIQTKEMLHKLENNPRVLADKPEDPMSGIRGPIKHSLTWVSKAQEIHS